MKAKKIFMIGFLMASLAASGFAAYQFATAGTDASCCMPGCCGGAVSTACCQTGN